MKTNEFDIKEKPSPIISEMLEKYPPKLFKTNNFIYNDPDKEQAEKL